jgi:hypothetical protein
VCPSSKICRKAATRTAIGSSRQVIFFRHALPSLLHNVSPEVYVERLNSCLDYLRRNFYRARFDLSSATRTRRTK